MSRSDNPSLTVDRQRRRFLVGLGAVAGSALATEASRAAPVSGLVTACDAEFQYELSVARC